MSTTNGAAISVLERFPDRWHVIVQLCKDDEEFCELCEHYSECQMVLARLRASIETDQTRLREYESTTRELELEIRMVIEATVIEPLPSKEIAVDRPAAHPHHKSTKQDS